MSGAIRAVICLIACAIWACGSGIVAAWYVHRVVRVPSRENFKTNSVTLTVRLNAAQMAPPFPLATSIEEKMGGIDFGDQAEVVALADDGKPANVTISRIEPSILHKGLHGGLRLGLVPFALKDPSHFGKLSFRLDTKEYGIDITFAKGGDLSPKEFQLRAMSYGSSIRRFVQFRTGRIEASSVEAGKLVDADWDSNKRLRITLPPNDANAPVKVLDESVTKGLGLSLERYEGVLLESKVLIVEQTAIPDRFERALRRLEIPLECPYKAGNPIALEGQNLRLVGLEYGPGPTLAATVDGAIIPTGNDCHPPNDFWGWWGALFVLPGAGIFTLLWKMCAPRGRTRKSRPSSLQGKLSQVPVESPLANVQSTDADKPS